MICGRHKFAQGGLLGHLMKAQLNVTHAFARTLQQLCWIGKVCTEEKPYVCMRGIGIHICEGCISHTKGGALIMDQVTHVFAACTQFLKPGLEQAAKWVALGKPQIHGGIASACLWKKEKSLHSGKAIGYRQIRQARGLPWPDVCGAAFECMCRGV